MNMNFKKKCPCSGYVYALLSDRRCLSQSVLCFIEERQCCVLFSLHVFMYTSKSTIDRRRMIDQRSSLFSKMFFSWFQ